MKGFLVLCGYVFMLYFIIFEKKINIIKLIFWGSVFLVSGIINGGFGEFFVCFREINWLDVGCVFNSIVEFK